MKNKFGQKVHKHPYHLVPLWRNNKWMWHCMKCGRDYKRSLYDER